MDIPKLLHPDLGYVIELKGDYFQFIGFGGNSALWLDKTNKRKVRCRDCNAELLPEQGLWKNHYGSTGYICMDCAKKFIGMDVGRGIGFVINLFGYLQAVNWREGIITVDNVCSSFKRVKIDGTIESLD